MIGIKPEITRGLAAGANKKSSTERISRQEFFGGVLRVLSRQPLQPTLLREFRSWIPSRGLRFLIFRVSFPGRGIGTDPRVFEFLLPDRTGDEEPCNDFEIDGERPRPLSLGHGDG